MTTKQQIEKLSLDNIKMRIEIEELTIRPYSEQSQKIRDRYRRLRTIRNIKVCEN